jgi:hypothetical protein
MKLGPFSPGRGYQELKILPFLKTNTGKEGFYSSPTLHTISEEAHSCSLAHGAHPSDKAGGLRGRSVFFLALLSLVLKTNKIK